MAVIDVGPGATNRAAGFNFVNDVSVVDLNNPANDTGTLDTFEIFALSVNLANCLIGTVYGSGTKWTARDYETIGTVTYGSKQTFTGKSCTVSADDVLAIYATSGSIERDSSGYSGGYYTANSTNVFGGGSVSFSNALNNNAISVYATGATVAGGSLPLKNVFSRPFSGVFR